jgi:hypothetical protein
VEDGAWRPHAEGTGLPAIGTAGLNERVVQVVNVMEGQTRLDDAEKARRCDVSSTDEQRGSARQAKRRASRPFLSFLSREPMPSSAEFPASRWPVDPALNRV